MRRGRTGGLHWYRCDVQSCDVQSDDADTVRRLLAWFERHERPLPWRRDRNPYRVWVGEVMLQQTRADVVARRYPDFLEQFPNVEALAAAPLDTVLKAWEGLGYYRRARLLHEAAQVVVEYEQRRLPASVDALRELPGFGPYTAAAVAALGFGARTVAVDANVRRVGSRLLGLERPDDRAIAAALRPWLDHAPYPPRLTEAWIELGALTCTPRQPDCNACPLASRCVAGASGVPEAYPAPAARRTPPTRRRYARAIADADGIWLSRRPEKGLLGGLWGVVQVDVRPPGRELAVVKHTYSHFRLELAVIHAAAPEPHDPQLGTWVPWARVGELALSTVDAKVLQVLAEHGLPAGEPAAGDRAAMAMMPA